MYLYLEDIGYFQMQEPETINDGNYEHKEITAYSIEKEFEQKDWLGLKINTADPDSLEQLAPGNLNDMGFAIEFVSFYNPQKPALSFVNLMLTKMPGWSIGHIDRNLWYATVPRIDVSNSNLYAIMTSEVAPRMSCVFVFDFLNKQVNAYHQSSLEFDTNIFVGFRNLAQEVEISVDEDSVFTEFRVRGDNDLSTRNANFGSDQVFDLSYFASKPWMSDATAQKYKEWLQNREAKRPEYITLAREAAKINEQLFEVRYRVPSDDTYWKNWDNMNEEGLQENLKYYKAQLELLQVSVDTRPDSQKYDSQGNYTPKYLVNDEVDHDWYMNLLHQSANGYGGYYTYQEIIWYIIPYIETAIYNLNKPSDQKIKYGDASAENWSLYGYIELEAKLKNYQEDKLPALDKFKLPWSQLTDEQKTNYVDESGYMAAGRSEYEHVVAMIGSESREGTIKYYLKKLGDEIESFEKQLKQVESQMESIADYVALDGGSNSFSKDEQKLISTLLVDTDYTNNNILTTSIDTVNTTIDHEIELYNDALEKLSEVAQPQYSFTVSLDNLLRIPMFSGWVEDLRLLRFIRLGIRDDYSVKLRVVGIKYNPCEVTPDLELEFSSMITSKSGRNDFTDILNNAGNRGSKNGISVGTGNSSTEVEYLTSMLNLMSKNGLLNGIIGTVGGGGALDTTAVNGLISRYMSNNMIPVNMLSGDFSLILNKLTAEEITTKLLNADEAHFEEVIAKYLEATTIISKTIAAESGDFEKLSTQILNAGDIFASKLAAATISVDQLTGHSASFEKLVSEHITADTIKAGVATIDALSADSAFFQYLQSLNSTAVNSIVTDSYIQNAIVNKLKVADLKAGDITLSDSMRILSENGQLVMNGTALQILGKDKDDKPYVGVQLGYDTTQNPSLILRNEDGEVVLTPQGITGEAIADQLIRTDMIHDGDITKEKLSFDVWSKDDRITIQNLYTETGDQFGTEWTNFTNKIDRIDRTAVTATTFYYYSSTSRDNPTGGTWTTDTSQLDYSAGRYIWQKEQITYANGDVEETDPVMITGNDGMQGESNYIHIKYSPVADPSDAQITDVEDTYIGICVNESPSDPTTAKSYTWSRLVGADGQPGGKGADGKNSYVHFAYATSADGTENFNVNNFEGATYLGVYTDDTLADKTSPSYYAWTLIKGADGKDGNDGTDGIGISDVIEYYQISSSGTTAPTSWTKTIPLMTETDRYLWNYEEIQYDDSPTHIATTTPRVIGVYGESGEAGRGISHITREYLASNKSTGVTRNGDSGWTPEVQSPTASKRFLWAYETRSYTSGDPDYDGPFIIGTYAESGADGRGVKNVKNYYLASTLDSGVTRSTSGWKETVQTMTATNKYLWNYEEVIYTSGNPDYTEPTIIGFYSKEGADGKGISSITEYYARSTGTTEDTIVETFTSTVKTVDATNKYLWNYELITYTDNSTSETTKRIIGMYSKDGSNGRGISNIKPYYLATSASSGVTRTTAGWKDTIQTMTATNKYLWSYDIISYTTGNPSYTDPHIVGVYGDKGDQGPAGKGIASIVNHYLASSSTTAPAKSDSKWTTTVQAIDATNRYLWNYETVNYTSGNPTETDPVIIGVYGQKGDQGIQGPKGDNGRGVTGIKQLYYLSTSGTQSSLPTPPTGWSDSAPAWEKNKYLWMCTEITYNLAPLKEYTTPYYDEGWLAAGEVYSELSSTISGVKSVADNAALNITNKVWQSDVKTAIKNLNIGGENLYDPSQIKSYKDGALNNATNITVSGNTIKVNGNPNTYPGFKVDVSGVTEVGNNKLLIVDGYYQYQTNTGADTNEFKNVVIAYRPFNQSGSALQAQATTPAVFDGATTRFTALLTIPKAANYVNIGIGQSYSKPYMLNAVTVKDSSLYDATTTIRDRLSQQIIDLDGVHTEVADIQSDINDGTLMSKLAKQNFTADGVTTSVAAMNTTLGSTSSLATQTSNKFSWIVSGGTSSSNMTLTSDFYNLVAENINLTGKVSFNSLDANTKSMLQPGLMMKVNYSAYSTVDDGEVYLHGYTDGVPADVDGYVWWNNKKITVPKKMINPNAICPYYTTLYIVLRLSSASSTSGTLYIVWYNNGWKYCITPTPSKVESSAWTWSEEKDIVIGQFIETASEGPVIDAYLYNPPRKGTEVQTKNAKNPYQYSSNAVSWVDSNSVEHANAITMLKKWSYNGAISATTTINGGLIQTNTILADAIAVDQLSAITANIGTVTAGILKSSDYAYTNGVFADKGIMLSLTDKLLRAVNFAIDASGNAYFKGTVKTSNVTIADANGKALASYGSSVKFYLPGTTTVATEFSNDGLVMSKGSININDRFMVNKDGGTTISYKQTDTTSSDILTVQRINSDQTVTKYIYLNDNGDLVINGNSVMIGSSSLTTAINDAVKGVSVGGRNLLLDTDAPSLTKVSSDYHRYFSDSSVTMITPTYIEVTDAPINCHYGSRYNVTATSAVGRRICWYNGGVVPMESGKEYTISVYARLTSGTAGSISFEYGVSPYASQNIQITNKKWERYSWTFTYDSTYGANGTRIYIGAFASNVCTLELCGYQLEKGNVATDWQVAPEDMEQRITKNTTAITTNSNQIKLMATKDEVSQQISKINVGGTNLLENSSFSTDLEKWSINGTGWNIVTQDGYQCAHVAGALKTTKYLQQSIFSKIKSDDFATQTYTISGDIKVVNYTAGTTNAAVNFYFGGSYDNNGTSTWLGATYTEGHNPNFGPHSNLGWVRLSCTLHFQHTPTGMWFNVYARDFTGDLYFKNLKLERGDHATDWSPAPEDATGLIGALTTRMSTAEAQISVQAGEIELRAKSSEVAEVVPGINLSPFFSHDITDKYNASSNPTGYWTGIGESTPFTFTQLADGWIHVKINNASGTGFVRSDWFCAADDVILPSTDYTFLFEFRNRVSTAAGTGDNYVVQGSGGCQFWSSNIKKNLEGTGTSSTTTLSSIPTDGSIYRKRFVKTSEAQNSSNRTANPKHMVCVVFRASAGEVIEFEYRASIYKGEYLGPYAPYVLSDDTNIKTMAANAQTTADGAASGVASLVTRVTNAETSISNNSKEIALRATMTQVNTAKSDAISQAGTATDNKLKSYSTTTQMNSAITTKANEITSSVSKTYATQETVTNLSTTVTQNHNSVTTAISQGDSTTMSRVYNNGVLVGKVGQSVCALVNANGSFQIVPVTWSGSTPTVGTAYASFGTTSKIGTSTIATASDISTLQNNLPNLVSNEVSKVEIGGQNLFRNSGNMTTAQWAIGSSGTVTDGILQLAPTTSVAYAKQKINYLDYAEYKDSKLTLSFDARYVSGNSSYTAPDYISLYYGVNLASRYSNSTFSSNYDRYAITNSIRPTSTWARYKFTFDLKQTTLTSGSQSALAAGNYITFEFDVAGSRWPVQFRKIKLERGSVATDWSPAPGEESAGYYATCSTSGSTQQKEGICPNFVLTQGATIHIKFNYKNTASSPTLNVNGTGAKQIYINGQPMTSSFCPWNASETVTMTYDGSYWQVVGQMNLNADNITAGTLSAVVINAKDQSNLGGWIVNKATTDSESSLRSDMVSLSGYKYQVALKATADSNYGCIFIKTQDSSGGTTRYPFWVKPDGSMLSTNPELLWYLGSAAARTSNTKNVRLRRTSSGGICFAEYSTDSTSSSSIIGTLVSDSGEFLPTTLVTPTVVDTSCTITANHSFVFGSVLFINIWVTTKVSIQATLQKSLLRLPSAYRLSGTIPLLGSVYSKDYKIDVLYGPYNHNNTTETGHIMVESRTTIPTSTSIFIYGYFPI